VTVVVPSTVLPRVFVPRLVVPITTVPRIGVPSTIASAWPLGSYRTYECIAVCRGFMHGQLAVDASMTYLCCICVFFASIVYLFEDGNC
jgi:hypothetical protein